MFGDFDIDLDPLLPPYFDRESFAEDAFFLPFRFVWDGIRAGLSAMAPPFVRELFSGGARYRRQYGFYPLTRMYRALRRPLHGGSWSGGHRNAAHALWEAVHKSVWRPGRGHKKFTLVLTDQRLLALSRGRDLNPRPIFELPRGSYGLRPDAPNSWWTKRVDLAFSDGSWIALDAGHWFFGFDDKDEARANGITTLLR